MIRRVAHLAFCVVSSVFLITTAGFAGIIIHVPANQPTIQAGINAANNGDTVLVSPGTYYENINFKGKVITVKGSNGTNVTIIDGGGVASVVTFNSQETLSSVLMGFTLQHGTATASTYDEGGGIAVEGSSPTIKNNIIQNNTACSGGAGIVLGTALGYPASALVQGNIIRSNSQSGCSGGGGGGISIRGSSTAQIIGNVIQNNSWNQFGAGTGGGIDINGGSPLIKNNLIVGNRSGSWGGAISMVNFVNQTVIAQNVIVGNSSPDDAGIYWLNPPAALVNNTITDGPAATGSSTSIVVASGMDSSLIIANNLFIATNVATNAFYCVFGDISYPQNFYDNDVFSTKGAAYGGLCTDQSGSNGNISVAPKFVSNSNLRLKGGSPAIDAGNNSAPDVPGTDFAGNPRIINGNGGATAIVDMGAYEFVPVVLAPKSLSFGLHSVGSTTSKTVKLTNAQNRVLSISSFSVPTGYSVTGCGTSVAAFTSCTLTVTFHPLTSGTFKGVLSVKDNAGNSPQTVSLSGSAH